MIVRFTIRIIGMGSRIILQPVQRMILRFLENAAQVFSHNTKTHQVQAAENRNQDRHRRPARYSLSCNDTVQYMQDHQHTGHSGKDTDVKAMRSGSVEFVMMPSIAK